MADDADKRKIIDDAIGERPVRLRKPSAAKIAQQAAAAAMGCLYAVAPYVFARAFDEGTAPTKRG